MSNPDDEVITEFKGILGQFKVTHSYNKVNGYTQVCVTLRGLDAPIVLVDGVEAVAGEVHVGVYDTADDPVRIDRNGEDKP